MVFFFQAEDGIRDLTVTGVQTCALPISVAAQAHRRGQGFPEGDAAEHQPSRPSRGPGQGCEGDASREPGLQDRKSTRLNSSHSQISYAVFCLKNKIPRNRPSITARRQRTLLL